MEVIRKNKTLPFFIFLLLFCMTFVFAAPPVQTTQILTSGLTVEAPIIEFINSGDDFNFHAHVYNSSNGVLMTNTSVACMIHIYNENGSHVIQTMMGFDSNLVDFDYLVKGGNFSQGQYAALFFCETNGITETLAGGFIEYPFFVTLNGEETSIWPYVTMFLITLFLFIMIVWLSMKFNQEAREALYKKYVTSYYKFKSGDHNANLGTTILTALAYGILKNMIVFYYLIIVFFMVLLTEFVLVFSLDTYLLLFTTLLNVLLWGFIFVFIIMIFTMFQIVIKSLDDISKLMRGIGNVF